ncbi:helix-turn-helix domain-containing protein [Paenibacillus sinopodophylli]|uniref:helix-turn-helix domain-containing protein n=1 Tax=Paenibacillus sinopodophylli TaxID=1837342 RepID=UPI00110CCC58
MALDHGECRLQEYRIKAKLTQLELSTKIRKKCGLDVSVAEIAHIENNRRPMSSLTLRAMSVVLKVPMEKFYVWPNT